MIEIENEKYDKELEEEQNAAAHLSTGKEVSSPGIEKTPHFHKN